MGNLQMQQSGWLGLVGCLVAMLIAGDVLAHPADEITEPRAAFQRGRELAGGSRDPEVQKEAAYYFARAHALQPADAAVQEGLISAREGDAPEVGMALVDAAFAGGIISPKTGKLAAAFEQSFKDRVGRIDPVCSCGCTMKVDGKPLEKLHGRWVGTGRHEVELQANGRVQRETVEITPGRHNALSGERLCGATKRQPLPSRPPRTSAVAGGGTAVPSTDRKVDAEAHGLSPAWFWVGVAATGALGAVSVWSALDTKRLHDEFEENGAPEVRMRGESAQNRTNVLFGLSALAGVGTGVIGLVLVDWGAPESSAKLGVAPGGALISGRF